MEEGLYKRKESKLYKILSVVSVLGLYGGLVCGVTGGIIKNEIMESIGATTITLSLGYVYGKEVAEWQMHKYEEKK
jgi:hypothetical protein